MATKLIRQKIEIFDQKIGKDSPDKVKFALKQFSEIHYAELRIQLATNAPSPLPLSSFKLTKLVLNNFTFYPSDPINSINIVHQSKTTCPTHPKCLGQHLNLGENVLFIHHDAPLLAGLGETFVSDVHAMGQLLVVGVQQINPVIIVGGGLIDTEIKLEKMQEDFGVLVKRNTPFAIFLIIAIVIIVIAIAYIVFKASGAIGASKQVIDTSGTPVERHSNG